MEEGREGGRYSECVEWLIAEGSGFRFAASLALLRRRHALAVRSSDLFHNFASDEAIHGRRTVMGFRAPFPRAGGAWVPRVGRPPMLGATMCRILWGGRGMRLLPVQRPCLPNFSMIASGSGSETRITTVLTTPRATP